MPFTGEQSTSRCVTSHHRVIHYFPRTTCLTVFYPFKDMYNRCTCPDTWDSFYIHLCCNQAYRIVTEIEIKLCKKDFFFKNVYFLNSSDLLPYTPLKSLTSVRFSYTIKKMQCSIFLFVTPTSELIFHLHEEINIKFNCYKCRLLSITS